MKIIILHGNALVAQSEKIRQLKKEFGSFEILEFSGKEKDFQEVLPILATPQLFSSERLIILDNFDEKNIDLEKLPQDESLTLVFKFSKPLNSSSPLLKTATKFKSQIIPLSEKDESSIFPFLDDLSNKNAKAAFSKMDKLYEELGFQYILTMIFYMLRRLILPTKSLPPFVLKKLESQKLNFPKPKIIKLYRKVLETDFKIKSGLMEERVGLARIVSEILGI